MSESIKRPCTPEESLKQALKEMKLMREGKLDKPEQTWREFMKELDKEID